MYLAIDTSTGTSVAVVDATGRIHATRELADTMHHAEVIGTFIREVLEESGITVSDLTAVACGMGPGPFTGLRIGIAAARTFGLGARLPVIPLVSHDAVALDWYRAGGDGELLVTTDARRKELYWSRYSGLDDAGLPHRIEGPGLSRIAEVDAGPAARRDASGIPAAALGVIAGLLSAAGRPGAADEPLYLRSPDIAAAAPKKRVTQ